MYKVENSFWSKFSAQLNEHVIHTKHYRIESYKISEKKSSNVFPNFMYPHFGLFWFYGRYLNLGLEL